MKQQQQQQNETRDGIECARHTNMRGSKSSCRRVDIVIDDAETKDIIEPIAYVCKQFGHRFIETTETKRLDCQCVSPQC